MVFSMQKVLMLKPGINNFFKVAVVNDSSRVIVLKKNQKLRFLEYVNFIVPLEVKEVPQQQ